MDLSWQFLDDGWGQLLHRAAAKNISSLLRLSPTPSSLVHCTVSCNTTLAISDCLTLPPFLLHLSAASHILKRLSISLLLLFHMRLQLLLLQPLSALDPLYLILSRSSFVPLLFHLVPSSLTDYPSSISICSTSTLLIVAVSVPYLAGFITGQPREFVSTLLHIIMYWWTCMSL